MAHTAASIQTWIDNYTFVDNATASSDILSGIVKDLSEHGYTFGPTENSGYTLSITGPVVTQDFIVKADK